MSPKETVLSEYQLLCQIISRGGRPDINRLHKAGLGARFPAWIGVLSPGHKDCPALTLLHQATQLSNSIRFSGAMGGEVMIVLDGVEYMIGPWLEAFSAINKWRGIVSPRPLLLQGDKPNDTQGALRRMIAELPTTYVGLDFDSLVDLTSAAGWNTNIQRISPIKPAEGGADTVLANHVRELLPLCLGEVEILADDSIAIPHPIPNTPYRFEDWRFMQIVEALMKRTENLQPISITRIGGR